MRWITVILIILPFSGWAQIPSWQLVNIEPALEIKEIVSDSLGFLWMHDGDILYRFDGAEAINHFNLGDEKISSLQYSTSDYLVVGTNYGRVIIYNPYSFEFNVLHENKEYHKVTNSHVIDNNNFIILYYGLGIVTSTDGVMAQYTTDNGLISNEVYDVALFDNNYFISTDQGIQILNPKEGGRLESTITVQEGLPDIVITHLDIYQNKLWYTDYDKHLGSITKDQEIQNYILPKEGKVNDISTHESGIYLATDKGIFLFDNKEFKNKSEENKYNLIQIDEEGNLWSVSDNDQLVKGNLHFQKMILDIEAIRTIEKYDHQIILGNDYGVYRPFQEKYIKVTSDNVTCLKSINEFLLVGTFSQGVKVYDKQFNEVQALSKWTTIENESVLHIYTHNNEVYISSLSGVMKFEFKDGKLIPINSLNAIIGQAYIYTMLIQGEKMYFGTDRDGLYIWLRDKDKIDILSNFQSGEKVGSVYSLTEDKNQRIWFTSSECGLGYMNTDKAIKLANVPNSKDEYTSLQSLKNGNLLAIRGSSVDVLDPVTQHFMFFDKEVGLKNEVTYLNNILLDHNQTFFVRDHNIFSYSPESNVKIHPEVSIDKVRVNLSTIRKGENQFEENENNIEFDFRGSWLTDPSKLSYQYKLEGFDEEWRSTKDNSVSFPRLRPGIYRFRLRASENGLFYDEPEADYHFQIHRKFYNQRWFRLFGIGLLGFVILVIIKQLYARKKEKLQHEKLNIENQLINLKNQLNPHFLFNTFNTLIGLIEEDSERSIALVEKMTDFYRNVLNYGKLDIITLGAEREILAQYIAILKARFNSQINIVLDFEKDLSRYAIPPMTLQLLVENAVKHNVVSSKNPLTINIKQIGNSISIKNKKSPLINASSSTKIGLVNIKRRFELINLATPIIHDTDQYFEVILKVKTQ
ncbi:MAG: ligand-binding sensor domain-containing protein [Saprospiraceae bacterium]|jgi:ligand-binding sensor domain-containing protein